MISNLNHLQQLHNVESAFDSLADYLEKELPNSIIALVQLNEKQGAGYVNNLRGIESSLLNKYISLLGINPLGKNFKTDEEGLKHFYANSRFKLFNGDLYELSGGIASKWVFKTIEKIAKIKSIYSCGISVDNHAIGTVVVFPRENDEARFMNVEPTVQAYTIRIKELIDQYTTNIFGVSTRDRFTQALLDNISHEIRTPLNGIIGLMDAGIRLLDENENTKELTNVIWKSSKELTNKLDNLLLIADLESQVSNFKIINRSASSIKQDMLLVVRKIAKGYPDREIIINDDLEMLETAICSIDLYYFEIAIRELIINALKFSDEEIVVNIKGSTALCIQIQDKGIGMTPEESVEFFTLFQKQSTKQKTYEGLGIGLNIVRHIVKRHNWDISVHTIEEQGTTVELLLPCRD